MVGKTVEVFSFGSRPK